MEMGCIPGEAIMVEQIAPLGDPISITVAGYQLSLRKDEAESIWITRN
jgi:ferrous iron transport protein A